MNPKVDEYLNKAKKWQDEMKQLRMIILDCGLTEELKWGVPCYTFQKSNLVAIGSFKEYCLLSFFKGSLLSDYDNILLKGGENTKGMRTIRFTNALEIVQMTPILKAYIDEAIEKEKVGVKVEAKAKEKSAILFPEELQKKFDEMPGFKAAFEALTPGRQRAYIIHFSEPKLSKTRESRVEKCVQQILEGKELNYQYM